MPTDPARASLPHQMRIVAAAGRLPNPWMPGGRPKGLGWPAASGAGLAVELGRQALPASSTIVHDVPPQPVQAHAHADWLIGRASVVGLYKVHPPKLEDWGTVATATG